ncbi:hypothetical protein [Photobacterium minamisatsumaniensis]|uniref:hypothetical protein n=1 Tax=Photobacterium minamisatsumaniensis TaxID=2910233 RepID=UPI003D114253
MKKTLVLSIGTLLLSSGAIASQVDSSSYQIDMDGDIDTIQVRSGESSSASQRRTNFFTGLVYNEAVFDRAPKRSSYRFVYLDGSTRINENFRFRHVLSESWVKEDKREKTKDGRVSFTLAPRYEQWVNPNVSWFAEPVYIRQAEAQGTATQELKLKPGVQFTFGQHFISTTGDYQFKWRERYDRSVHRDSKNWQGYSADVNYVYRYSPQVNFGASVSYNGTTDHSDYETRRKSYNVKPFVRFKHFYDITTEMSTVIGHEESGQHWNGYDYVKFNINNNKRINSNLRFVANFQYGDNERHSPAGVTDYSGGDKQEMQVRVGFNITL